MLWAAAALIESCEDRFGSREDRSESFDDVEQSSHDLTKSSHVLEEAAAVLSVFPHGRFGSTAVVDKSLEVLFQSSAVTSGLRENLSDSRA